MSNSATVIGNVIITNGTILTIPNGFTLDFDFANFGLLINSGGGVLIKAGATIT